MSPILRGLQYVLVAALAIGAVAGADAPAALSVGGGHGGAVVASSRDGLYVTNVDGTGLRRLTRSGGDDDPVWSPDGSEVAFDALQSDLQWAVLLVRADGTGRRLLHRGSQPEWSPDGTQLAFDDNSGATNVSYVSNAAGTRFRLLGAGYSAYWSPDSSRIALAGSADGVSLILVGADGANPVQVKGAELTTWAWSPDSGRLAFGVKEDPRLYVTDASTGATSPVAVLPGSVQNIDWRSDGAEIAVEYGDGDNDAIDLVAPATGGSTPIVEDGEFPYWSPDGSRLAFLRGQPGNSKVTQVVTVTPDGAGAHVVGASPSDGCYSTYTTWLQWTDTSTLLFRRARASSSYDCDVWHGGAAAGSAQPTTRAFPTGASFDSPDWTQTDVDPTPVETFTTTVLAPTRGLELKLPVDDLAASEGSVAFTDLYDQRIGIWGRDGKSRWLRGIDPDGDLLEFAYAGDAVAWTEDDNGAPPTDYLFTDSTSNRAVDQAYEGDNRAIGNLYGGGGLIVYNTWLWREVAGVWRKTDGALWRIVGDRRNLVVRGPGALNIVDVNAGRICVLRPGGVLALLDPTGRLLRSVPVGAAKVDAVRLTATTAVLQRGTAIEVWDLGSGRRVKRFDVSDALGPVVLQTAASNEAVYAEGIALHVLRLADGQNRVIALPGEEGPAHAVFDGNRLVYSFNSPGVRLGHIRDAILR